MNAEEFILVCIRSGYASKKNARKYAEGRNSFTEEDLILIHEINERKLDLANLALRTHKCNLSGNQLVDSLNKNPKPWNQKFDASRGIKKNEQEK